MLIRKDIEWVDNDINMFQDCNNIIYNKMIFSDNDDFMNISDQSGKALNIPKEEKKVSFLGCHALTLFTLGVAEKNWML